MTQIISNNAAHRWGLAVALGSFLYLCYLLTYSGMFKSDDEIYIIDTTDSFAVRTGPDRLLLNESVAWRPGLLTTDVEPAQPIMAMPLYWLAYQIPWVGNVHALYLFNPIVTAITAILIFHYALDLGYGHITALTAGLLFGVGTIVWPYTRTFFREPLTMLNLFAAWYFIDHWRLAFSMHRRSHWRWLAGGVLTLVIALLSKESALIALPVLVVLGIPSYEQFAKRRRSVIIIGITLFIIACMVILGLFLFRERWEGLGARYQLITRIADLFRGLPDAWYYSLGYLFSPGKGIWWYSPILILSLCAPFILPARRWRESWLSLALVLLYVVSYAAIRGQLWHGGAGWGARYMAPLTPFLMLASLPALDTILRGSHLAPKALLGILAWLSIVIQFGGLYVNIHDYYNYQQKVTGLAAWNDNIIWSIRWSQAVGSFLRIPHSLPDILWLFPQRHTDVIVAIIVGMAISCISLIWMLRELRLKIHLQVLTAFLPLLLAGVSLFALARANQDPHYEGHNQELRAMHADLADQAQPNDVILLATPYYAFYFMNYYKDPPIWYSLPVSPGERYDPQEDPVVVSDQVQELIHPVSEGLLSRLLVREDDYLIWLVSDHGPSLPWATRPVEWYMAERMFQVNAKDYTSLIRLVEYLSIYAPSVDQDPAHLVTAQFGRSIELVGYDLVTQNEQAVGEVLVGSKQLGVSLVWRSSAPISLDYTVAVYLIDGSGTIALQQDRPPVGGFAPTSRWIPGELIRDNFGFVIPDSLSDDDYQIWVAIYSLPSLDRLPVTTPDGTLIGDHIVLGTLRIE